MKADVQQLRKDAEALASAELRPLPDDDLVFVLRTAYRLEQAVKVLQARMVREAASHGLPRRQGFRTVPSWLRALLCVDPQPARELAGAADALAREPAIEQAVIVGEVDLSQATVIAATIDGIPDTLAELDLSADGTSTPTTRVRGLTRFPPLAIRVRRDGMSSGLVLRTQANGCRAVWYGGWPARRAFWPRFSGARGRFSTSDAADDWSAAPYDARYIFATADAPTPDVIVLHDGAAGTI